MRERICIVDLADQSEKKNQSKKRDQNLDLVKEIRKL